MGLKAEIQDAVKQAMRARDELTLSTLRLLLSAVHNEEIRVRRELSDDDIQRTIGTLGKQRAEAIDLYRKGGREDLAANEDASFSHGRSLAFMSSLSPAHTGERMPISTYRLIALPPGTFGASHLSSGSSRAIATNSPCAT